MTDMYCPECDLSLDDEIDIDFDEGDQLTCPKCYTELVLEHGSLTPVEDDLDEDEDDDELIDYPDDEDDDDEEDE